MKKIFGYTIFGLILLLKFTMSSNAQNKLIDRIKFIDCYYENASPILWEVQGDSAIKINFLYDYERGTTNRQSTHINFKIEAEAGTELNLILSGFKDIYDGKREISYGRFTDYNLSCYFSEDYKNWTGVKVIPVADNNFDLQVKYKMKTDRVYIAKLPVYSLTHLERFENSISQNRFVKIIPIGYTVEKRPLEIIRVGYPNAPFTVLIRARAHPWESAGNWVVEGIIKGFIEFSEKSDKWSKQFCYYIMPMANKDGTFRGMTRFNVKGSDLNRGWGFEADSVLTPENYLLEKFINKLIADNKRPDFIIDFHNNDHGNIYMSKPVKGDTIYKQNMDKFLRLIMKNTWYSGIIKEVYDPNPCRFGIYAGLYERLGINSCVIEINGNWIVTLKKIPSANDWEQLGKGINEVFFNYFK
jgi:hypothetical protein